MIDQTLVKRLSLLAGVLLLVAAAAASILVSPSFGGGILLGGLVGGITFLSWIWFSNARKSKPFATLLLVVKLGLYGGLFYLFVTTSLVHPVAVFLGITGISAVYATGVFNALSSPREDAR